jgi:hypothetical protein
VDPQAASNGMRLAEFTLPGPGGEVTLVVSRFKGGGGDAASNVNRWKTQFTTADGARSDRCEGEDRCASAADDHPRRHRRHQRRARHARRAQERYNEPNSRLLGVIVEGAGDPYFFKLVGAAETVVVWEPAFRSFADSIAPAAG